MTNAVFCPAGDTTVPRNGAVKVTFLGVSTLLLDDGETQLMTDGFFTRPPLRSMLSLSTNTGLVTRVLKRVRADRVRGLFVAHSHHDHAMDAAFVAKETGARLYGSRSTLNIGRGGGVPEEDMELYRPGVEIEIGGFHVTALESRHSPQHRFIEFLIGPEGEEIERPLPQPAWVGAYKEGGSYDLLIRHGNNKIFIKPSAHHGPRPNAEKPHPPAGVEKVDVVFLGVGSLSNQKVNFKEGYYRQTVRDRCAKLVIPIHWDNFFKPLSEKLPKNRPPLDEVEAAFAFLRERAERDGFTFHSSTDTRA